ncbi:hypothetical protein TraAM80_07626 [Trypanosoma rangeli]|uniref:Uncharacterized protein n=1 Tax=Trypanosoma rangeli TaxID=5698 RepID=A0A422N4N9_TRYRA|nr:uncharacterized protein TraAM80_07626 [Trypanosoma rangeli]RNF00447.1 hypothetical protein TraAM80_07626 [Trypanosoma rangeli]|eukprot:RNF00447.1 hypothetical protein TraAM80_07626 [Trypanosoma rangeli]
MTEVSFSPCPIFSGEVEDYYCTSCHTTCSGLSLLVGPHTGHNRVPLTAAIKYLPAALQRDASTLVTRIQEEYVRPKTAHCNTLHATLTHMQQERQRKRRQLEELQRELGTLDKNIDTLTEECAMALCHWSHQREGFLRQVQRLLQGADTIAKTLATRVRDTNNSQRSVKANGAAPAIVLPPGARQAVKEELNELRRLLAQPLAWLEYEEGESAAGGGNAEAKELGEAWQEMQPGCLATDGGGAVVGHRSTKESYRQMSGVSGLSRRGHSRQLVPSDAAAVLEQLLATHREPQIRRASPPLSAASSTFEEDGASGCDTLSETSARTEQRRWQRDFKQRERLLREGLDRCMCCDTLSMQRATAKAMTSDETDVNYLSGSSGSGSGSGSGSVREAVDYLLRHPRHR